MKDHPNQGDNMPEATYRTDFDTRLAALDRAIDRLHANDNATPDEVVALAEKFERYLTRTDG